MSVLLFKQPVLPMTALPGPGVPLLKFYAPRVSTALNILVDTSYGGWSGQTISIWWIGPNGGYVGSQPPGWGSPLATLTDCGGTPAIALPGGSITIGSSDSLWLYASGVPQGETIAPQTPQASAYGGLNVGYGLLAGYT